METLEPRSPRIHAAVLLGLAIWLAIPVLTHYQPYTFLFRDGSFYAQTSRAIARDATLRQESFQPGTWYDGSLPWYRNVDDAWSNVSVGVEGEWYPKHSYVMPVVSTPFFLVWGSNGLLAFNALMMLLGLYAGYRLAERHAPPLPSAVAVFIVAASPLVPYLTYAYSHDVFYGALVVGGLALLAHERFATGGFLLGLSVFAKLTNAILILPMIPWLLGRNRRAWTLAAVAGAVPVGIYAAANTIMFGAPWITSYHRILTVRDGQPGIVSYQSAFDVSLVDGFRRYFQRSGEGELWQMSPQTVLAWLGLPLMIVRFPLQGLAVTLGFAAYTAIFAVYHYGGARFMMPILFLSVVPMALLLDALSGGMTGVMDAWRRLVSSRWRRVAIALLIAGHVVGFAISWGRNAGPPTGKPSLSRDVEALVVRAGDTRCDYFNMAHKKWECSGIDRAATAYTGLALGRECAFLGVPAIRVPRAASGRFREVTWTPSEDIASVRIAAGLEAGHGGGSLKASLTHHDRVVWEATLGRSGEAVFDTVAGPFPAGTSFVIRVDPGTPADAALCIEVADD
jgi:hypothetical protein